MTQFTDQSTATPEEKTRRFLRSLADPRDQKYFFGDGFPRQELVSDAAASLAVVDKLMTPAKLGFQAGVYRHYKGAHYLALGLARADETDDVVVVYTRLYEREGLPMSTRKLEIWNQSVEVDGQQVPRFTFVGHQTP